jgi:ribonuclease P protein component
MKNVETFILHTFHLRMKRSLSLRRGAEFQQVWDEGKSFVHPLVILRARPNSEERSRFGFVAGRKIGKATVRNRVKRWMRESIRLRLPLIVPGWDLIWIARAQAAQSNFAEMDAAITHLLQRAALLRAEKV